MIDSGEAESRAVAGAVKSAIGQARLDAGVNITGLLVDIDLADSMDYRQHFMCWHLTRVLRPSLTEKVPPAVVRSVVDQETVTSRIISPNRRAWTVGSPLVKLFWMQREVPGVPAVDNDDTGMVGDNAGDSIHDGLEQPPVPGGYGYLRDRVVHGSATRSKRHFIKVPDRPMRVTVA